MKKTSESFKWDKGAAFFSLLNENIANWDGRDCFFIDDAQILLDKLDELDPTGFVAQVHLCTLMEAAGRHVNFSANAILSDERVATWLSHYKQLMTSTTSVIKPLIKSFSNNLKKKSLGSGIDIDNLSSVRIAKLLKDAVGATDAKIDWIYTKDESPIAPTSFSTKFYRYPSINGLELDVINHDIPYGCHLVGVDIVKGNSKGVTNVMLCNTPNRAFILSNMHFSFSLNEMINSESSIFDLNALSSFQSHFPNWINLDKLPSVHGSNQYIWSDITQIDKEQAVWLFMVMELMSIISTTITPSKLSATVSLISDKTNNTKKLPAVWVKPFELNHHSLEDVFRVCGVNKSINCDLLTELLKGVTIDTLLPFPPMLGFDLFTKTACSEDSLLKGSKGNVHTSIVDTLNRYGRSVPKYLSDDTQHLNLYPLPDKCFGNEEYLTKATNDIIVKNFKRILSGLKAVYWTGVRDECHEWFKMMLKKKILKVVEQAELNKNYYNTLPNGLDYKTHLYVSPSGFYEFLPYKICEQLPYSERLYVLGAADISIHKFIKSTGKFKGFKTKSSNPECFLARPMNTEDIMTLLGCKRTSLPKPLQNWHRTSGAWSGRAEMTAWIMV